MARNEETAGPAFYRSRDLDRRIPVSRVTRWRWIAEGKFPAPLRFGNARTLFWDVATIEAWIASHRAPQATP
jgi:predicted DNA-binding transcriptional regulator AlpA